MSAYYVLVTAWALVSPFQYGYHTAALNQIQDALTCQEPSTGAISTPASCVEMSKTVFGIVTASFTLGGFMGSSSASLLLERWGRRGVLVINSFLLAVGSAAFAGSSSVTGLIIGRLFIGFGCGLGLCALPLYLAETAPSRLKDKVGVLNQLSITVGILATQAVGLPLAKKSQWRLVLTISSLLAVVHAFLGIFVSDTPAWLAAKGRHSDALAVSRSLHGSKDGEAAPTPAATSGRSSPTRLENDDGSRTALLSDPESPEVSIRPTSLVPPTESVGLVELLTKADLRRALLIVSTAMIAQQGSGINAVIYYSTDILKEALTADAALISILIAVVNVVMTFAPVILIGKYGTRRLLLASIVGSLFSTLLLGYGLDSGLIWLSSITILTFVASFALGLGPVPFMLTADLVPYYATSSLSAFALSLNWISNFIVGVSFLPLRDLLASIGDNHSPDNKGSGGKGRVFYLFAALLAIVGIVLSRLYKRR